MRVGTFELERVQSIWENTVDYNLTESGLHPYSLKQLLDTNEIDELLNIVLGYGQTDGSINLRDTISSSLYPGMNRDNIIVTNGSAEANYLISWTLLEPGDEIIIMLPNYMQIYGIAQSFGVTVIPWYLKEERNWGPDVDELESLVTPKTKAISVCNPNNPTGSILSEDSMRKIVQVAEKAGAWLLADEIYRGSELDGIETPTFSGLYDKVVISSGLSKAYAHPGVRLGWLAGPKNLIDDVWRHKDYTSISTGLISQYLGTLILHPARRMKVLSRSRKILKENLAQLQNWLVKHPGLFQFVPPRAGGMAFLRYYMDINSTELATRLREEKSVFVVAGDCYGMDKYLRIGIGGEKKRLVEGLDLISEMLREFN